MKIVIALVALAGLYFAFSSMDVSKATEETEIAEESLFTVAQGDVTITVTETGYLKAKNSEHIKPGFKRSATITWLIDEGTKVDADEKLVDFDKTDIERDIEDTKNSLIQYEAELEAARASLAIQERDGAASIEKFELQSEIARLNLKKFNEGDSPNENRKLALEVRKAVGAYERAKDRFKEAPQLQEQGFLTALQVEEERISLLEAEFRKENAERDLLLYQEYTEVIDRAQKEADVKDAERELKNAREAATINLKEAQAKLTSAERKLKSAQDRLAEYEEQHEQMTIRSPSPGIVHYGDPDRPWYRDNVKVGSVFYRGNTIITLPDLSEMQLVVQVHEADIDLIDEGMDVKITIEAVKGEIFDGTITDIASVADSNWTDPTNKRFDVEISMEAMDRELRAGITARAEIHIETLENVVHVPIHSVTAEEGEHFVFVHGEGGPERSVVKIGKNNAHYVEVLEGLEPGQRILLYDPRSSGFGSGPASAGKDDAPSTPAEIRAEA